MNEKLDDEMRVDAAAKRIPAGLGATAWLWFLGWLGAAVWQLMVVN